MRLRGVETARLEWAALIGLVALFVWKGLVPAWQSLNTDFPNYYLAARLFRDGFSFERFYDWIWFQRQKDHAGIVTSNVVGYLPLSPFSALLVLPLVGLSPLAAKHAWLVLNLALLGGTIFLLRDLTRLPARRIALITFLTVVPLRSNFLFGQQHLLVLFLLTLAAWLLVVRGQSAASGVVIAVAAALKLYPALFALYLARKRRWAALAALVVGGIAALALGLALFGREPWRVYLFEILPRSMTGEANHPYWIGYNSPAALLRRLFIFEPQLNPRPLLDAPVLYSVLGAAVQGAVLLSMLWCMSGRRTVPARERLELGAFTLMLLVMSAGSSTYHLCPMVLSTVLAVDYLLAADRKRAALAVVVLHAFIAAPYYRFLPEDPAGWRSLVAVPRLWAMVAFWIVYVRLLASAPGRAPVVRGTNPSKAPILGAAAFAAFAAFVAFAAASTHRHLRAQAASYRWRLPVQRPALLAAEPAVIGRQVYFSRMDDSSLSYTLDRTDDDAAIGAGGGEDLFHPAFPAAGGEGWVEVASLTSRIARFRPRTGTQVAAALETEAEPGEQPAVSPDGRWLGFIREQRGRGSLWVKDRQRQTTEQVLDVTHDVRSFAFFPDGRLVAASAAGGGSQLRVVDRTAGSAKVIDTDAHRAKDPAVSPDGRWLAYSREERGAWQLWVMDLAGGHHERLTDGGCNSVQPAWAADSRRLVYASDCGRGVGQTALCARDDAVR